MELNIKNISSLEKVRNTKIMNELEEINSAKVLAGENYSYQVCCTTETRVEVKPTLWQRIKQSKIAKAFTFMFKIRIRIDMSNALPEGRGENN